MDFTFGIAFSCQDLLDPFIEDGPSLTNNTFGKNGYKMTLSLALQLIVNRG